MSQNIIGDVSHWKGNPLAPVGFNSLGGLATENEYEIAQRGHGRQGRGVQVMNTEQLQRYHMNI